MPEGVLVYTGQVQRNPALVGLPLRQVGRQAGGAPHPGALGLSPGLAMPLSHGNRVLSPRGVDKVIPWHLPIWLEDVLKEIHLLQGEASQPPAGALTRIFRVMSRRVAR